MRITVILCLILLTGTMAGCVRDDPATGRAFEALDAPQWHAGQSWTYVTRETVVGGGFRDGLMGTDADNDRSELTLVVFNTTEPLEGKEVYYVRASGAIDNPFFPGSQMAILKDSLTVVASGSWHPSLVVRRPDYSLMSGLGFYGPPDEDPCNGQAPLSLTSGDERIDALRFPLEQGGRWQTKQPLDEFGDLSHQARVVGMETVTVPAGLFEAVRISHTFTPMFEEFDEMGPMGTFSVRADTWYAPDVEYFVKTVLSVSLQDVGSRRGQSLQMSQVMLLDSFTNDVAEETPAPPLRHEPVDGTYEYRPYEIVTDTAFPINIADGPITARFGINHDYPEPRNPEDSPQVPLMAFSETLDYAHETHEARWYLTDFSSQTSYEGTGDTFEHTFEDGGAFYLSFHVAPVVCGYYSLGSSTASFESFWEKAFDFQTGLGTETSVSITEFPVGLGALNAVLTWSVEPTLVYPVDHGSPAIYDPSGTRLDSTGEDNGVLVFQPHRPGNHSLTWESDGPRTDDQVAANLRITYRDQNMFIFH